MQWLFLIAATTTAPEPIDLSWQFRTGRPPIISVSRESAEPPLLEPEVKQPVPAKKPCFCSPACTCGCNSGQPCKCQQSAPLPVQQNLGTYQQVPSVSYRPVSSGTPVMGWGTRPYGVPGFFPSIAAPAASRNC